MSTISENLKFLRKRRHWTQQDLADALGIKRSLVGAYEEARAEPPLENLIKISKCFDIELDLLLKKKLVKLSEAELEASRSNQSGLKVLSITVDKDDHENVHLIPHKAAAGYTNGYADPEYIAEMPQLSLPMLGKNGTFRAFEITGDSMLPLESGTVVIGQYVDSLDHIKNGKSYIVVTHREGIVFKRVFNYIKEHNKLFLVSDNNIYPGYDLPAEEIIELWEAKAYISVKFPDPKDESKMSLEQLTSLVLDLKKEISNLQK